jgi:proteasome lid subunit RPN8/RPN11
MRTLIMTKPLAEAILEHAHAQYPNECCGALLARCDNVDDVRIQERSALGDEAHSSVPPVRIQRTVPLENVAPSPRTHYVIAARSLLNLEREATLEALQVIGFYHSHPAGPAIPSETDCKAAVSWYTYVIAGLEDGPGRESLRAYSFEHGAAVEVRIELATSPW